MMRQTWIVSIRRQAVALCGALLLGTALPAAAQYTAIDLTPPASDTSILAGQDAWAEGNGNALGVQVGAGVTAIDSASVFRQAGMWTSAPGSFIFLMPSVYSEAYGTDGVQEVGFTQDPAQAALWSGSAASYVNLHPANYAASIAYGCSDGQQVGWGLTPNAVVVDPTISSDDNRFRFVQGGSHALLWSGTALSVVDLNPAGFDASIGRGIEHGVEVGSGVSSQGITRALRWTGTPGSVVDISPLTDWSGNASQALGIQGGQTVGYCQVFGADHAAVWNGPTAADRVDLHPAEYYNSVAYATNGVQQVGAGNVGAGLFFGLMETHALLWSGTADSVVDLHRFLPEGWQSSVATGIGADGTITIIARGYQSGNQPGTNALSFNGGTDITHTYLLVPTAPAACAVASVTVDQSVVSLSLTSNNAPIFAVPVHGTVTLTAPAPAGGAVVRLLNPAFYGRETSVTVPEGTTSAAFLASDPLLVDPMDVNYEQIIEASYGGVTKRTSYITLGEFPLFQGAVRQGLVGQIQLATPVDADEFVTLSSSDPSLVQVPPKILLKKGMAFAGYPYTVTPGLVDTIVSVSGMCSRGAFSGSLVVHGDPLPSATITALSPSSVPAGTGITLTVTGSTFAAGAQVVVNGNTLPANVLSPTSLTVEVPGSAISSVGSAPVQVVNPHSFPSASATLTLVGPTLNSISPNSASAGTPFTMTLKGANFVSGAQALINGNALPTTFVSSASLTAAIPGSAIPLAGSVLVQVLNPGCSTPSGTQTLSLQNPKPTITTLSPSSVPAGSPTFTLTITGTNFVPTSQARWNGSALTTTYVSPTQIQAAIPAANLTKKGNFTLTVQNPSPGGGGSNGVNLVVN